MQPLIRLVLGSPDDPAELAAHCAAHHAMRGGRVRVRPAGGGKPTGAGASGRFLEPALHRRIVRATRGGRTMPEADRRRMEDVFAADFCSVRLHTGPAADRLCRSLDAHAFTVGQHVFLGAGYRRDTASGRALLAHELAHVLQRETGIVRRYVMGGRDEMLAPAVEKWIVAHDPKDVITTATAAGVDYKAMIQACVDAGDRYSLSQVYDYIYRHVDNVSFVGDVETDVEGVWLKYEEHAPTSIDGVVTVTSSADQVDVHPGKVVFSGKFAVKVRDDLQGQWTLGITQTVLSADRTVVLSRPDGSKRTVRMWLDAAALDRRPEATEPWYDASSGHAVLDEDYQAVVVAADDQPGFVLDKEQDEELESMSGEDTFATWLVLRNDGGDTKFLHRWDWSIAYQDLGGKVSLTAADWYVSGDDAVLSGTRAGEAVQTSEDVTKTDHEEGCICCVVS